RSDACRMAERLTGDTRRSGAAATGPKLSVPAASVGSSAADALALEVAVSDKQIHPSSQIGDGGIALIHLRTQQMGFVWHNRTIDAGIDGSIEVRNPATGAVANRHLFVQSKASNTRFPGETADSFHYICDQRDIDYWLAAEVPVLLICSHPDAEQAWWADVSRVFMDPVRRASGRVDFTKSTDRFDRDAAARLLTLADPHADAHMLPPTPGPSSCRPICCPSRCLPSSFPSAPRSPLRAASTRRCEPLACPRGPTGHCMTDACTRLPTQRRPDSPSSTTAHPT
ncbi:MAG: DUF4365 domain-containing protein, partial [Actinobacteria bacterium]|nr:DUF4365 domain-containing protein [Actinomycetota bacterium]